MGEVVPGDPRSLSAIEAHLAKSDPALAAKFAVFAGDPDRARASIRQSEQRRAAPEPSRHARARLVAVLSALAVVLAVCITLAALASSGT